MLRFGRLEHDNAAKKKQQPYGIFFPINCTRSAIPASNE